MTQRLAKNGRLTPKALVEEARPISSPIHDLFEWNDAVAAEKHREAQAAAFIRTIVVLDTSIDSSPVRAYVSVGKKGYAPIHDVVENVDIMETLLESMRRDARAFVARYEQLRRIAAARGVFEALEKFAEKVA